jgi:hypothetical protein
METRHVGCYGHNAVNCCLGTITPAGVVEKEGAPRT